MSRGRFHSAYYEYSAAGGHGGQVITILDKYDILVVVTGNLYRFQWGDDAWTNENANQKLVGDFIEDQQISDSLIDFLSDTIRSYKHIKKSFMILWVAFPGTIWVQLGWNRVETMDTIDSFDATLCTAWT